MLEADDNSKKEYRIQIKIVLTATEVTFNSTIIVTVLCIHVKYTCMQKLDIEKIKTQIGTYDKQ